MSLESARAASLSLSLSPLFLIVSLPSPLPDHKVSSFSLLLRSSSTRNPIYCCHYWLNRASAPSHSLSSLRHDPLVGSGNPTSPFILSIPTPYLLNIHPPRPIPPAPQSSYSTFKFHLHISPACPPSLCFCLRLL
ncbi:hypothetical protein EDD21DRAFT_149986 [Dissophora ornata]|nr:hypothetical protein EDD21DRAFT_149986 [Dissophora ornata]